jgi:signal transduction histidine kinase
MTVAMVYLVVLVLRRGPGGMGWRVLLFGAALTLIGVHDMLALSWVGEVRWVGMLPLVIVVFASWTLLDYLLEALREAEELNTELDRRVEEKHQELERSYDRMRVLERDRALASERERMVQEMHDGMGGLLVSTLALVEGGRPNPDVAESLREVLDEMRLMMDSLDPASDELVPVLANLRSRVEPLLARHDLVMEWGVSPQLESPRLEPGAVHHLLRIAQEAISNVIRHARARKIRFGVESAGASGGGFVIEIADDGVGLDRDPSLVGPVGHVGRGIRNMERRAREMGGRLEVVRDGDGTTVRLWIPSRDSAASARSGADS